MQGDKVMFAAGPHSWVTAGGFCWQLSQQDTLTCTLLAVGERWQTAPCVHRGWSCTMAVL